MWWKVVKILVLPKEHQKLILVEVQLCNILFVLVTETKYDVTQQKC